LWVAGVWVGQEALRGRAPFGGFPWGRLAFSQPEGPFTPLAALGGAPLVTAAVAAVGALLAGLLTVGAHSRTNARSRTELPASGLARRVGVPLAGALALTLAGLAVPLPTAPQTGTLAVAAVQGNVPDDL
nr:apolipoprotein N-acyltransferase [Micromonospora sp. DSM 115978]